MATIYGIRAKDSKQYFYVGSTKFSAEYRLQQHLDYIRADKNHNRHFVSKIKQVGIENLIIETLEVCNDTNRWQIEDNWIKKLKAEGHKLTNLKLNEDWQAMEEALDYDNYPIRLDHIESIYAVAEGKCSYNGDWLHDTLLDVIKDLAKHLVENHNDLLQETLAKLKDEQSKSDMGAS